MKTFLVELKFLIFKWTSNCGKIFLEGFLSTSVLPYNILCFFSTQITDSLSGLGIISENNFFNANWFVLAIKVWNCIPFIFPVYFISSNIHILFQVYIFRRTTWIKEGGQTGCVVELHHTTPHFLNLSWPSNPANMKKSVQKHG